MDRNDKISAVNITRESVDRNPSSATVTINISDVALRKESVDRNTERRHWQVGQKRSLSARRAWIEIKVVTASDWASVVALRKESVDRNCDLEPIRNPEAGRSPQGERG